MVQSAISSVQCWVWASILKILTEWTACLETNNKKNWTTFDTEASHSPRLCHLSTLVKLLTRQYSSIIVYITLSNQGILVDARVHSCCSNNFSGRRSLVKKD